MVDVVREPIKDEQAEMPPADFCGFGLEHMIPDFLTLVIECKCRTMEEWSQFISFASCRVQ